MDTATEYQIFITFDLESAESKDYKDLHDKLEESLGFDKQVKIDGELRDKDLPNNILATVKRTTKSLDEFIKEINENIEKAFEDINPKAHYVVIISDNASVILKK